MDIGKRLTNEGMNSGDYRRYIKRYKNASALIFVLILGSNEAVYKMDKSN